jgi:hypothetical protein
MNAIVNAIREKIRDIQEKMEVAKRSGEEQRPS